MARLAEFRVVLPPLRERREDVPGLFRHFLRAACGGPCPALSAKLVEALCAYAWPLNVSELRNVARQIAVLHSHERELQHRLLPLEIGDEGASAAPNGRVEKGAERDARDLARRPEPEPVPIPPRRASHARRGIPQHLGFPSERPPRRTHRVPSLTSCRQWTRFATVIET